MDFLKNVSISLKVTGLAAVAAVWMICMTILGLSSGLGWLVILILNCAGAFICYLLGRVVALEDLKERIAIIDRVAKRRDAEYEVGAGAQDDQNGKRK